MMSIPGPDGSVDVTSMLDEWICARDGAGAVHVHPCHRLDRDTSGVMLYARGKAEQKVLMACFAERETTKVYLCVVHGKPGKKEGLVKLPIEGREALTQYQVLGSANGVSLVKCKIHTGRSNQIRIHFASMGHPLVGDSRFGRRSDNPPEVKRTLLHAWFFSLPPQVPGLLADEPHAWTAPLPEDMHAWCSACGRPELLDAACGNS